jgi:hypothetical protein
MEKQKNKKKIEVASPSAWAVALREEGFFLKKKTNFFPECLGCGTRGRVFF